MSSQNWKKRGTNLSAKTFHGDLLRYFICVCFATVVSGSSTSSSSDDNIFLSVEAGGLVLEAGTGVTVRGSSDTSQYEIGDRFNAINTRLNSEFYSKTEVDELTSGSGGYDPQTQKILIPDMGCSGSKKCGECQGQCSSDSDCQDDLYCAYQNRLTGRHPGCARTSLSLRVCVNRKHQLAASIARTINYPTRRNILSGNGNGQIETAKDGLYRFTQCCSDNLDRSPLHPTTNKPHMWENYKAVTVNCKTVYCARREFKKTTCSTQGTKPAYGNSQGDTGYGSGGGWGGAQKSCFGKRTYADAKQYCESHGARLCRPEEHRVCPGSGCSYDAYKLWMEPEVITDVVKDCPDGGCGECAGPCTSDKQCKKGLKCFNRPLPDPTSDNQRAAMEVPGCGSSIFERTATCDNAPPLHPDVTFAGSGASLRSSGFCYKP